MQLHQQRTPQCSGSHRALSDVCQKFKKFFCKKPKPCGGETIGCTFNLGYSWLVKHNNKLAWFVYTFFESFCYSCCCRSPFISASCCAKRGSTNCRIVCLLCWDSSCFLFCLKTPTKPNPIVVSTPKLTINGFLYRGEGERNKDTGIYLAKRVGSEQETFAFFVLDGLVCVHGNP
jgi:hypothetical protein